MLSRQRFTALGSLALMSVLGLLAPATACSDEAGPGARAAGGDGAVDANEAFDAGEELRVVVPAEGRVYVKLASPPAIVTPADPLSDRGWDLAFEGAEVYTNSGPSGSGNASAFGPLDPVVFLGNVIPDTPLRSADKAGGAFLRWYFYEGAPSHVLHSRFHVYGVKDGDKLYRVQVLGYYGTRDGASVNALYKVRYGEVGQPATELTGLDGTAGADGSDDEASECLDLGTGRRMMLTPEAARQSAEWHLCFRRQNISVNGEMGGPRGVVAADFDIDETVTETLAQVSTRTPESELARFDAVTADTFAAHTLRGDRVVSAFSNLWTERGSNPIAPGKFAWVVAGADGKSQYLVGFSSFEGATATHPGTIVMRVKAGQVTP